MSVNAAWHRIFRVVSGVLFLVALLGAQHAQADLAPDPYGPPIVPAKSYLEEPLIVFFAVIVLAVLARIALAGLRSAVERPHEDDTSVNKRKTFRLVNVAAFVVLLGFLMAIIVPKYVSNFMSFHLKRQWSEEKSNLGAIRSTQVAFVAEWGYYIGNQPPTPVLDRRGRKDKVAWVSTTRFSILGFAPEGKVYCSYTLEGPDYPTKAEGFTARAECDYDGDGNVSVWTITSTSTDITHSGGTF